MRVRLDENDLRMMVDSAVRRLLNEGTDVLYHFTDLDGLIGIVRDNRFELTDNRKETEGGYVFSLSRTKTGGYLKTLLDFYNSWIVRLTLDGRKLNQRYKTYPIDDLYMYPEWVRNLEPEEKSRYRFGQFHWPKEKPGEKTARDYEYEDRVVARTDEIPDALSYIERIDIYIDDYRFNDPDVIGLVLGLASKCLDRVHLYKNLRGFINQSPGGESPVTDLFSSYWYELSRADISSLPGDVQKMVKSACAEGYLVNCRDNGFRPDKAFLERFA